METPDHIDDLSRENNAAFDYFEPPEGHEKRFEAKLQERLHKKHIIRPFTLLKIAAVLVMAILSSLWIIEKTGIKDNQKGIALQDVSSNYAEVQVYYTSVIDNRIEQLKSYPDAGDQIRTDLMKKEFRELDSLYSGLRVELKANPGDERIIEAMITYYRTKLDILNRIIDQLNKVKPSNANKNEKPKVISSNTHITAGSKIPVCVII